MTTATVETALASFRDLRALATGNDRIRAWLDARKNAVMTAGWDIVPRSGTWPHATSIRARQFADRRRGIVAFFSQPSPDYAGFADWLKAVLEDVLVIDALAVFLRLRQLGTTLDPLDGATIEPRFSQVGGYTGCSQSIGEVPRRSLVEVISNPTAGAFYVPDRCIYGVVTRRTWTPFGYSPLEQALVRHDDGTVCADATAAKLASDDPVNPQAVTALRRWLRDCLFNRVLDYCGGVDLRWEWDSS